jgi:hypothetical protein
MISTHTESAVASMSHLLRSSLPDNEDLALAQRITSRDQSALECFYRASIGRVDGLALRIRRNSSSTVSILEADACDVIGLPEGSALQNRWEARAARRGVRLNCRMRVPSFEAQCRLIASGVGVALLPEASARRLASTLPVSVVPLTDPWVSRQQLIAVKKVADLPTFTQRLVRHLASEVPE